MQRLLVECALEHCTDSSLAMLFRHANYPHNNVLRVFPATSIGSTPCDLQNLKRIIRELKLNTGQSFWKNHVTREDFIEV